MMTFPTPGVLPTLDGMAGRQMTEADADAIMALQALMLEALPDPTWYYPSERALFAACCQRGEAFGYWQGEQLAGFGILTPWYIRPETCYAHKVNEAALHTFDFQDVMVHPGFRRRGIHASLLSFFERLTREAGGVAMFCTIAPDNLPSVASFTKAGFVCIQKQPAYAGMLRGYYRKWL